MKRSKDEYLMLREEILHLDTVVNNTINFFYVFVSAVLAFTITQDDSMFVLISYIVIIPSYLMVLSKEKMIFKIGAYLNVFHEGKKFNWERRNRILYSHDSVPILYKFQSFNFPFLFVSTFITLIFCAKTDWHKICIADEVIKVVMSISLYIVQLVMIVKNRRISSKPYITLWENVKNQE